MTYISGYYQTCTGDRDFGSEKIFSLDKTWLEILLEAIKIKAILICKTSYVSPSKPRHWYLKGYRKEWTCKGETKILDYDTVKTLLENNLAEGKYPRRQTWLIKI